MFVKIIIPIPSSALLIESAGAILKIKQKIKLVTKIKIKEKKLTFIDKKIKTV